jgi:hypothetical protein
VSQASWIRRPAGIFPTASIVVILDVAMLSTVVMPAPKFSTGHSKHVAQHPWKRCVAVHVNGSALVIYVDRVWHRLCLQASPAATGMRCLIDRADIDGPDA